jgi:hypothetical protein
MRICSSGLENVSIGTGEPSEPVTVLTWRRISAVKYADTMRVNVQYTHV